MKKCSKCGSEKPLTDFYSRSDKPHLRMSWCKQCFRDSKAPHPRKSMYGDNLKPVKAFYRLPGGDRTAPADQEIKNLLENYKIQKDSSA